MERRRKEGGFGLIEVVVSALKPGESAKFASERNR
jgi:hypothetical protein